MTIDNYRDVLRGLKLELGANGVRLPIFPQYARSDQYSALYAAVVRYAKQIGLAIYASPMSVGMAAYRDWSDIQYVTWLANYIATFQPDFLSPFNEPAMADGRIIRIVRALRESLPATVRLVGPDRQRLDTTLGSIAGGNEALTSAFDILDSHNASGDDSATAANWARLASSSGGKPVWSSENPADWSKGHWPGAPGLDQAVAGGVRGLVIWRAKPAVVTEDGRLTRGGCEIYAHLHVAR